jgi:hypothetical protein
MKIRKRAVPVLVAASAFVVVVVAMTASGTLREEVRAIFVVPLLQGFYIIRHYIDRLPQLIVWIAPLLFFVVLLIRAVVGTPSLRRQRAYPQHDRPDKGELARLARQIHHARVSRFARVHVCRRLSEIAIRLIARRTGVPLGQARAMLRTGQWDAVER